MPKDVAIEVSSHRSVSTALHDTSIHSGKAAVNRRFDAWADWVQTQQFGVPGYDPRWLRVLSDAMGHAPHVIEHSTDGEITGLLPLMHMSSRLFGDFLVGLPYVNVGGVCPAIEGQQSTAMIDASIALADRLGVRHLELRHEREIPHPAFNQQIDSKVHMRLELPTKASELWDSFKPKVRNQVRKANKAGVEIVWGREQLLTPFYKVFSRNMRDLGTPVFHKRLFASVLKEFSDSAEICVAMYEGQPVAGALLVHGTGVTEVPSASSIKKFNPTCANMKMYWHLLERSVERGQSQFDFGRSTLDSQTYRFKKQWGAKPHPACWQFYVRRGSVHSMRPEAGRYSHAIRIWRRLPVGLANLIGPHIIRGVP